MNRTRVLAMILSLSSTSSAALAAGPIFTPQGGIAAPGQHPAYSIDAGGNASFLSLAPTTMVGETPLSAIVAEAKGALQMSGGDVSRTVSIASGATTPRTQADRAADTINVMDFGASGDDIHDDTVAINNALAFARTLTSGKNGPYAATFGPYAHVVFPSGHRFRISGTLNFTGFQTDGLDIDGMGSSIDCHATGQTCVDAIGSNGLRFDSFHIVGDANDMPRIGMQIGRTDTYLTADNHTFYALTIVGQFTFAALYNFAAETTTFIHPELWNFSGRAGSYALVQDDYNHFGVASSFQTITAKPDVPSSFNENLFVGADVRSGIGLTVPMWLGGTSRLSFIRSYVAGGGTSCAPTCFGAIVFNEGGVNNAMLHLDVHFETSGLTDVFQFSGDNSQAVYGFDYLDQGPQASNSIFKVASNVTYVEIRNLDVSIAGYPYPAERLFDDPSKWRAAGRYASGSATGFNATAWQGQLVIGSNAYLGNYGSGAIAAQSADSTAVGGNARGADAVDWQSSRTGAGQVAGGNFSTIGGGQNNTASGPYSTVAGGVSNNVTNQFGAAVGYANTVSGLAATGVGIGNIAAGAASLSAGSGASDNGNDGTLAWATGSFASPGDATASLHVLRGAGAGPFRLTTDAGATASTCLGLPAGASYALSIILEARDVTTGGSDYLWRMPVALIARGQAAGSTSLSLGSATTLSRGAGSGALVNASADPLNDCLNLAFNPPAATGGDLWHAVARIDTVEVR
jgi:hypothetical protein